MNHEFPKNTNEKEDVYSDIDPEIRKHVDKTFDEEDLLVNDALNDAWITNSIQTADTLDELKPVLHYEEYLKDKYAKWVEISLRDIEDEGEIELERKRYEDKYNQELKYIMLRSDPNQIALFDALADEFNADLERIRAEKDVDKLESFTKKAIKIVKQKRL